MKFFQYFLLIAILFSGIQSVHAQKTKSELPDYILAENAAPIVYLSFVQKLKSSNFGSVWHPSKELKMSDFPMADDAYVNMISSAIDEHLRKIGIKPGGYVIMGPSDKSPTEVMEEITAETKRVNPYYNIGIAIWDWEKVVKKIKKAGEFTLDMQDKAGFSMTPLTAKSISDSYMVTGCKDLQICMDYLQSEVSGKSESYFLKTVEKVDDLDERIEISEKFTDLIWKEENRKSEWPEESLIKAGKTIVLCGSRSRGKNAYKWAHDGLEKFFPYDHDMFTFENMGDANLDDYDYALIPVAKMIRKSKENTSSVSNHKTYKTEVGTEYYYVLKDLKTFDLYLGPEPKKIDGFAMSDQPLALRRFLKIMSKGTVD